MFVFLLEIIVCIMLVFWDKRFSLALINMAYWLFFIIIGSIYFYDKIDSNKGAMFILLMCIVLYIGTFLGRKLGIKGLYNNMNFSDERFDYYSKKAEGLFSLAYICEFILVFYSFIINGFSVVSLRQFLIESGGLYFLDTENTGIVALIMSILYAYLISIFALDGYFTGGKNHKIKLLKLLIGAALYAVMSSRKSILIWPVLFWHVGLITGVSEHVNVRQKKYISILDFFKKYITKIIPCLLIFIVVMVIMFLSRKLASGAGNKNILDDFLVYMFGEIPVFDGWLYKSSSRDFNYTWGEQTFYGIVDQLGIKSDRVYSSYSLLGYGKAGSLSNIYTLYRELLEDFGYVGCALVILFSGILVGFAEKNIFHYKNKIRYCVIIEIIATFVVFSFIISAWHYFTVFIADVLFAIELLYIKRIKQIGIKS